jgi:diacylglycerol kinase family enzyme
MSGIGIVTNPRSARNRRQPDGGTRLARLLGSEGLAVEAATPEALDRAVEAFRAGGIDTLAVNGGDGTTHRVLSALAPAWGEAPLPRLLPLRGGTMNTLAGNHGLTGEPETILADHLAARRAGGALPVAERDLIRIEADGRAPVLGFLFGTGAAVSFLERFYAGARRSPLRAWLLLARASGSVLLGGPLAQALVRHEPLRISADGEDWPDGRYLMTLAGTVPSIGLGFRALARCDEQPGFFHLVGIHGSLPRVVRMLPRIHRGGSWRRRAALDAVARRVTLEGEAVRFMVDGDLYGPARRLRITTGPLLEVLLPTRGRRGGAGGPV